MSSDDSYLEKISSLLNINTTQLSNNISSDIKLILIDYILRDHFTHDECEYGCRHHCDLIKQVLLNNIDNSSIHLSIRDGINLPPLNDTDKWKQIIKERKEQKEKERKERRKEWRKEWKQEQEKF